MPRVPQYERQVSPGTPGTPQAPQGAFGSGQGTAAMGQALDTTAQDLEKRALQYKEEQDANKAMEAYTQAADRVRKNMYDPERGILNSRGKNALNSYQTTQEQLEKIHNETQKNLENDEQRRAFESMWNRKRTSVLESVARHQAKEHRTYKDETTQAMINTAIEDAAADPMNGRTLQDAQVMGETAIRANSQGKSPDVLDRQLSEFRTKLHGSVIERMAETDAKTARAYYEKNKDQMDGTTQTQVEKVLNHQGVRQESQAQADRIVGQTDRYQDQLAAAREIEDPEVRDDTVRRVKARHTEQEQAQKQARQDAYDSTIDQIIDAPDLESAMEAADNLANGSDRMQARKAAQAIKGPQNIETDPAKYAEARQKIDQGEISSEQELIGKYWPHLGAKARQDVSEYYRQGGAVGDLSDSTVRTIYQSMTGEQAKENPEKYQGVWDVVTRNIDPNKKPTDAELRKIISLALVEGEREGGTWWGYGEEMPYEEAQRKGYTDSWLPDVDETEKRRISQTFKGSDQEVTHEKIRLYKKHVKMGLPVQVSDNERKEISQKLRNAGKKVNDKNIRLYKKHVILGLPYSTREE